MRIVFAGTPEFAACQLAALCDHQLPVAAVYTQPDRPAGRGRKLSSGPVKAFAVQRGLPVLQPVSLKDAAAQESLRALRPDVLVVVAYGLILPQAVLDIPRLGCVNLHASLLPRWRGAAPIQRALQSGDERSGVCLMKMDAGLDTGPVLAQAELPLRRGMTAQDLHDQLAALGAAHLPGWIEQLDRGELSPVPQAASGATYAQKLSRAEAQIDWHQPALSIERAVCAFNPWPGAHTQLAGEAVKIWAAQAQQGPGAEPGRILRADGQGIEVACGQGNLLITTLQWPGGRRLDAAVAAHGRDLTGLKFDD